MDVVDKVFALLATWDVAFQMTFLLTLVALFSWFLSRCFQVVEGFGNVVISLFWGWPPSDDATCRCKCCCDDDDDDESDDESDDGGDGK